MPLHSGRRPQDTVTERNANPFATVANPALAGSAGSSLSQTSVTSPAITYPPPCTASTGMMPASRLR